MPPPKTKYEFKSVAEVDLHSSHCREARICGETSTTSSKNDLQGGPSGGAEWLTCQIRTQLGRTASTDSANKKFKLKMNLHTLYFVVPGATKPLQLGLEESLVKTSGSRVQVTGKLSFRVQVLRPITGIWQSVLRHDSDHSRMAFPEQSKICNPSQISKAELLGLPSWPLAQLELTRAVACNIQVSSHESHGPVGGLGHLSG